MSTTYNRMKDVWKIIYQDALSKPSPTRFEYCHDGQMVRMFCSRTGTQDIPMPMLRKMAEYTSSEVTARLAALLPEGVDLPPAPEKLTDNSATPESFLDEHDFQIFLKSIRQNIENALFHPKEPRHKLFRTGRLERKAAMSYLKKDQHFMCAFAMFFEWLCGNPARAAQAVDLCFRGHGGDMRNMYLMARMLILGWPKRKVKRGAFHRQASLWAFPASMAWELVCYFGVLREIIAGIVCQLGGSSEMLRTHIFVDSVQAASQQPHDSAVPSKDIGWTPKKLNDAIKSMSPPQLKLDDRNMRQLFANLTGKFLPKLTEFDLQNPLQDANNPMLCDSQFDISQRGVEGFVAIGQIWRSFWGLESPNPALKIIFFDRPRSVTKVNNSIAFHRASQLVLSSYLVGCCTPAARLAKVRDIFDDLRFLRGEDNVKVRLLLFYFLIFKELFQAANFWG